MFNLFKKRKEMTPDEMMYNLYKKKDKRVKNLEKIKYNGKGLRKEEIANECIKNLLDLNHDLHFNSRKIIFAYSMDNNFKEDILLIHHFIINEILVDEKNIQKINKLNTINTNIITNIEGLHDGQFFYAKLTYFYNLIKDYLVEEKEIFLEVLNEYEFIAYFFVSFNNYICHLNNYYKNEFKK